jgi:HD-GYP domain-containing protein (c-di-GMP phosphodiesterase class II)
VAGQPPDAERVRTAEVIAALSLATDLGMGFPLEHSLSSTLVAMRLADRLGVDEATRSQTYYGSLLVHIGCTADAAIAAGLFETGSLTKHFVPVVFGSTPQIMIGVTRALAGQGSPPRRAVRVVTRLPKAARGLRNHRTAMCEVGRMLTERLGLPGSVSSIFGHLTERWDGRGQPSGLRGAEIPLALRIVHVAADAAIQHFCGGSTLAARVVRERAGHAFDPAVAGLFAEHAEELMVIDTGPSPWDDVLAREPSPHLILTGGAIDRALVAMGDFADLVSPCFAGHAGGVAELATAAARRCALAEPDVDRVRRAAHVHDLGRVGVAAGIWQKAAPLTLDEREQVRLHPYYTERVLAPSAFLSTIGRTAGCHHERLDGSGYHRGLTAANLSLPARLVAAADAFHAMTRSRPYRPRMTTSDAAAVLSDEVRAGRLCSTAVTAVLEVAGERAPRPVYPAGLSAREVQVVAMLAGGMQTKQIARAIGISVKTADRHVQNAYAKIGISTRAAATLFAMRHGLTTWGEFPIDPPVRSS